MSPGPAWARPVWTAGGVVTGTHRPAVPVRLFRAGKVLPILAGPGLLDVRERPGVRGGLRGARGLHRAQVLHPGGKRCGDRLLEGGSWGAFTTRRALTPRPGARRLLLVGTEAEDCRMGTGTGLSVQRGTRGRCTSVPGHRWALPAPSDRSGRRK